jgi:DNA (cytosine-5)-methyltransferase 1
MANPHAWNLTDLKDVQPNGISVMSTFACGGGSSMGYKRLGCEILAANDIDPEMEYHYKLNLKPKHYFLCPIKDLITAGLPPELFSLDILDGSPPVLHSAWQAIARRIGARKSTSEKGRRSKF